MDFVQRSGALGLAKKITKGKKKRHLLLRRKAMTNLNSVLNNRDIKKKKKKKGRDIAMLTKMI